MLLNRSTFLASAVAATLTTVSGEAAVLPRPGALAPQFDGAVPDAKVPFAASIGATASQYEASFAKYAAAGYVLISLDIYGDVGNERYAAVWVKRQNFGWVSGNGMDLNGLVSFVNQYAARGFVPTILAATGDLTNQTCAVVMEATYNYFWWWLALPYGSASTAGTFQHWDAVYRAQNYDLAALAVYGDAGKPLYLAAWSGNGTATPWADSAYDTSAMLTSRVTAEYKAGYRPKLIARNAHGAYASIYHEDSVGPWTQQHEISAAAYEKLYAALTAKGYMPISLRAGGTTAAPVFAAVFAETDLPSTVRKLTITGAAVPAYALIESEMTSFMETNGVRAGQLTVSKNGVVEYERAFTYAEAGYPITQTTSLFRLASVSKAFVEAAVQTLFDQKKLTPSTLVFPRLGFKNPGDARSQTITVQQLLDHTGGYDDSVVPDPVFSMRQIALDLNLTVPITALQFVEWVYSQPLQFNPGAKYAYSNTGYAILSYLVSIVAGMPFIEFVQKGVMTPLGVTTGVEMTRTAKTLRLQGEVLYDDDEVGFSALTVTSPVLAPAAYGGDQLLYEVAQGASSIATSATGVTKLIHTWLVWGNGKRPAPGNWSWQRDGSMPGTTAVARSEGIDGIDFCFVFNTRNWPAGSSASPPDDLAAKIDAQLLKMYPHAALRDSERGQPLPSRAEALLRQRRLENRNFAPGERSHAP